MKTLSSFLFLISLLACQPNKLKNTTDETTMADIPMTYLALGDSYTIGEGVAEKDRYPTILVEKLNQSTDNQWAEAEIIAKTGWTVDELEEGINSAAPKGEPYDLVTLLIGVNNQYRGRSVEDFQLEFEQMLLRAIGFAGNLPNHVVVLSIPDWGVTPFAVEKGSDSEKVASEIDAYNLAKKEICEKYGVAFIDITEDYRQIGASPEMLVEDQLHPSGLVYQRWAQALYQHMDQLNLEES